MDINSFTFTRATMFIETNLLPRRSHEHFNIKVNSGMSNENIANRFIGNGMPVESGNLEVVRINTMSSTIYVIYVYHCTGPGMKSRMMMANLERGMSNLNL